MFRSAGEIWFYFVFIIIYLFLISRWSLSLSFVGCLTSLVLTDWIIRWICVFWAFSGEGLNRYIDILSELPISELLSLFVSCALVSAHILSLWSNTQLLFLSEGRKEHNFCHDSTQIKLYGRYNDIKFSGLHCPERKLKTKHDAFLAICSDVIKTLFLIRFFSFFFYVWVGLLCSAR